MSSYRYLVTNGPGAIGLELHLSSRTRPDAQTVTLPGDLSASTREWLPPHSRRAPAADTERTNSDAMSVIVASNVAVRGTALRTSAAPTRRHRARVVAPVGMAGAGKKPRDDDDKPRGFPRCASAFGEAPPGRRSRRRPPRSRRSPSPRLRARTAANARVARRAPRVRVPPRRSETSHPPLRPLPPSAPSPRVPSSSSAHPPAVR
jgi:hypothetical protein